MDHTALIAVLHRLDLKWLEPVVVYICTWNHFPSSINTHLYAGMERHDNMSCSTQATPT